MFIRGQGWKPIKPRDWVGEVIPDLPKDYARQDWLDYAEKYGVECAQEHLPTCDYMKPSEAYRMFHPPLYQNVWEKELDWFKATFQRNLWSFLDGLAYNIGNACYLDILKFERFLISEHQYPAEQDGSIKDFMTKTFGPETTEKFTNLFMKPDFPS